MKIGIVIHSHTGNTLVVAEKLLEAFQNEGHTAQIERVTAVNEDPNSKEKLQLANCPEVAGFDVIIIGAPVRAFSLSPVMIAYLEQLPQIHCNKVACFVTQQLPKAWMGGNRAIRQIVSAVLPKGVKVAETGIINWSGKTRDAQIDEVVGRFSRV